MFFKIELLEERLEEKGYVEFGELYGIEIDDDYVGLFLKVISWRSSFNISGSKLDGEFVFGDSVLVYGYGKYFDGEYSFGVRWVVFVYGEVIDIGYEEFFLIVGRL